MVKQWYRTGTRRFVGYNGGASLLGDGSRSRSEPVLADVVGSAALAALAALAARIHNDNISIDHSFVQKNIAQGMLGDADGSCCQSCH
jgi:hypothetical protein